MMSVVIPILALAFSSIIAAQRDWNQCFYAPGAHAPRELLPCLKEDDPNANGASWCCFAGDNCLEQNSCYDPTINGTGNLYQYGCNDPDYEHESCPKKCGLDRGKSPWVGLVLCEDRDREGENKPWVCNHPETCGDFCPSDPDNAQSTLSAWPFELTPLPGLPNQCTDLGRRYTAVFAPDPFESVGYVPPTATDIGSKPDPTRIPTRDGSGSTATTTATGTGEPTAGAAALGGGAIAGIAVGSALGVFAILAGVFFMWRRRRRRRRAKPQDHQAGHSAHAQPATTSLDPYPYDKQNMMYPNSPSTFSDGTGIGRPVSDMSMSTVSPTPMGSPRPHPSPYYQQGGQGLYGSHAELSEDARVYEMPAIREKSERSELP